MSSAASLERLLRPRSITIVGASPRSRIGRSVIQNSRKIGLPGAILPVNPNYQEVEGLPCYKSLRALPEIPDCLVILTPAAGVLPVLEEAGEIGIRAAVVVASGFGDARTEEGAERQRRLRELADRFDIAIAGPNCLGLSSFVHRFANTYTDLPPDPRAGGVSIISQSGGLLNAATTYVHDRGGGLNYLISGGNHAVVGISDYIDFLADDPATKVIACIMEGIADGRRFRAAIERASRIKPIVVLKLGRSEAGKSATLAHTGTLAGRDDAYAALFRQNGVAQAVSIDDLMETAMLLGASKYPRGNRCVMLTISGGTTGLIADLGEAAGLCFPALSATTDARLRKIFDIDHVLNNPIDTTGWPQLSDEGNLDRALDAMLADPGIDLVGIAFRLTPTDRDRALIGTLARRSRETPKPLIFISTVSYTAQPFRLSAPELADFPVLEDLENGQRAVSRLIAYGLYRQNPRETGTSDTRRAAPKIAPGGRPCLTEFESKKLLAEFGLPVTREGLARDRGEAIRLAKDLGYPVALKIQSPDVSHKSDAGGVKLGLGSDDEVAAAFDRILANVAKAHPQATIDGILVQEMAAPGVEVILGMTNDEQLGPIIVCGLGGIFVEVLNDIALRFPPIGFAEAKAMLGEIRGARLFDGYRGAPPCDVDALAETIVLFTRMVAHTEGQFAAIDINPIIVGPIGTGVRIADALIIPVAAE
jgi:acyl-CoA synthetase (NDP forming)